MKYEQTLKFLPSCKFPYCKPDILPAMSGNTSVNLRKGLLHPEIYLPSVSMNQAYDRRMLYSIQVSGGGGGVHKSPRLWTGALERGTGPRA